MEQIVVPAIVFTLENKGIDLFDNMYELCDALTFNMRRISPAMWTVFELTYKLFKTDAIDFLEGNMSPPNRCQILICNNRDAAVFG